MAKDVNVTGTNADFQDWIPVRAYASGSDRLVDWCYAGQARFKHPFFSDTLREILRRPFSCLFPQVTSLESLDEIANDESQIPPTGFVFHMSRCGSTLVAQMLAALECNLVISEAPAIDNILELTREEDEKTRVAHLRSIVGVLGRRRNETERNYFVKFDSWNTIDLDLIATAYPTVPWIFLYRDPIEVIVSQMRQRGSQMVPGAIGRLFPDLSFEDTLKLSGEEYCAHVLTRICERALRRSSDVNCLLVNYNQLPKAVTQSVIRHFDVALKSDELEIMKTTAQFDAKTPRLYFEPDSEQKRTDATDAVREAAKSVLPLYDKLESVRLEREGGIR